MSILLRRIRASPLLTKRLTPISSSPISPAPNARPVHIDHRFPPSFFNAAQHGHIAKQFSTVAPKPKDPNPPSPHSSSNAPSSPFDFVPRSAREKRLNRVWWFFVALNFGIAVKVAYTMKPQAEIIDVDLQEMNRNSIILDCKVAVNNPYDHPIPICEISFFLKSAGRVIVSGTIPDSGSLAAGLTRLDVPVKVLYSALFSLAIDINTDWDIDYELEIRLIIDLPLIGDITIPVSQKGELKIPTFYDVLK